MSLRPLFVTVYASRFKRLGEVVAILLLLRILRSHARNTLSGRDLRARWGAREAADQNGTCVPRWHHIRAIPQIDALS